MSEAEEQQLAESMAQQMTGMSMKEIQALSEMSEKEQMEYAKKKGLAGKWRQTPRKPARPPQATRK